VCFATTGRRLGTSRLLPAKFRSTRASHGNDDTIGSSLLHNSRYHRVKRGICLSFPRLSSIFPSGMFLCLRIHNGSRRYHEK
jgi:hypothetical protein